MLEAAWQILQIPLAIGMVGLAFALFCGETYLFFVVFYAGRNSWRRRNEPKDEEPEA